MSNDNPSVIFKRSEASPMLLNVVPPGAENIVANPSTVQPGSKTVGELSSSNGQEGAST
jgi:hypothetical protein